MTSQQIPKECEIVSWVKWGLGGGELIRRRRNGIYKQLGGVCVRERGMYQKSSWTLSVGRMGGQVGGGRQECSGKTILESGQPWYECCGESFLSSEPQFPLPRMGASDS